VITLEIAVTLVLLISGGLLIRSFARLLNSPFGFDPNNAFVVRTLFDRARYSDPVRRMAAQQELINALRQLPGVKAVAAASHLPLSDTRQIGFLLEHAAPDDYHWAENSLVSPGYFKTMGISLIRGRDFNPEDRTKSPKPEHSRNCLADVCEVIVSDTFAKKFMPGTGPTRPAVGMGKQ
jgi:putative ABC transport system permease protein